MFDLRGFPISAKFADPENMSVTIFNNLEREEDVATKRGPPTNGIYAEMKRMADAGSKDSAEAAVFNCTSLRRITGPLANEYAQKTQSKVDIHKYPNRKEVTKAYLDEDFTFFTLSIVGSSRFQKQLWNQFTQWKCNGGSKRTNRMVKN